MYLSIEEVNRRTELAESLIIATSYMFDMTPLGNEIDQAKDEILSIAVYSMLTDKHITNCDMGLLWPLFALALNVRNDKTNVRAKVAFDAYFEYLLNAY